MDRIYAENKMNQEKIGGVQHMNETHVLSENNYVSIKKAIAAKVMTDDHVSFIEVQRIFDEYDFDYRGNRIICHPNYTNLVLWGGWNDAALKLMTEVLQEYPINMTTANIMIYLIDGGGLEIPIAKKARSYQKERWYPVVLRPEQV